MGDTSEREQPQRFVPLHVASAGICCSVGNSRAAASAAIRGRLNHFQQSRFLDKATEPIHVAMLYQIAVWGRARLQHMYRVALGECLSALNIPDTDRLPPTILVGAERERGAHFQRDLARLLTDNRPDEDHDPRTVLGCVGKAGIAPALAAAQQIFAGTAPPNYVVIVGVDSFLDGASVSQLLEQERIRCSTNPDGFTPGEAAAAIAVTPRASSEPALWITGAASAQEPASPLNNNVPMRATGLTQALRGALASADCHAEDMYFHASAVSGEQWYFKEAGLAMDRIMAQKKAQFPHRLVAQSVGEIGAAFGPLMLAWIGDEMTEYDLGTRGLLHCANDNGLRAALVVQHD